MASSLPPAITKIAQNPFQRKLGGSKSLYQVLGSLPRDGFGSLVAQARWPKKAILSFYYVTRVKLKAGSNHGKAWGILFWTARQDQTGVERIRRPVGESQIRGGLKNAWKHVPEHEVGWKGLEEELGPFGGREALKTVTKENKKATKKSFSATKAGTTHSSHSSS